MDTSENFQRKVAVIKRARHPLHYMDDNIPNCIQEGLYLGSYGAALNKSLLQKLNITHILTVATSAPPSYPQDFVYKVIKVVDKQSTKLELYFDECIDFIDEAKRQGGAVLVHCIVGKSRSATIVAAYLMKKNRLSSAEALQFVKNKRPRINPNAGFISQLKNLEKNMKLQGLPVKRKSFRKPSQLSCFLGIILNILCPRNIFGVRKKQPTSKRHNLTS